METVVFSLGGSLIYPDGIDVSFLREFKSLVMELLGKGYRAVIVTGGGAICRDYNKAANSLAEPEDADLDWMGIQATKLNAELVRIIFGEKAYAYVVKDPTAEVETDKNIIVASGYKPGNSSDKVAVMLAEKFNAEKVLNLSNVDKVYDSNPEKNPEAKALDSVTWDELLEITGDEWSPGKNIPFDPEASKLAKRIGLKLIMFNGQKLDDVKRYFDGGSIEGTVIKG